MFDLTQPALDERLEQLAALAGRTRRVEDLSGGLTNRNVKVTTDDGVYVARISEDNAEDLDIDRAAEAANSRAAAEAGVGAPVVESRPDLGLLLIGFIDGVTMNDATFRGEGFAGRAAKAMRQLHQGPRFVNDFDMFARQPRYRERCRSQGFHIADGYDAHAETFARIRRALAVNDEGTVPCNNDLLAENFIDDGEKVWLIDYEYSGNNDPCFELGNTWTECKLDPEHLDELVESYFGEVRPDKVARARLQSVVSQYGWALWGFIQSAVSPLDFDFWSWGMERYEGAASAMTSSDLPRLLEEVTYGAS
ncbi:MAG: phosphotransferase [Marmoricola sp.]|nr:phosphotransferase [Marmoricola sp.]